MPLAIYPLPLYPDLGLFLGSANSTRLRDRERVLEHSTGMAGVRTAQRRECLESGRRSHLTSGSYGYAADREVFTQAVSGSHADTRV